MKTMTTIEQKIALAEDIASEVFVTTGTFLPFDQNDELRIMMGGKWHNTASCKAVINAYNKKLAELILANC